MAIRIYTSKNCVPCKEVEDKLKSSELGEDVEVIDIETDDGFEKFKHDVLDHSDGAVPSAFKDGQRCEIGFDDNGDIVLDCPTEDPDASGKD
jgi:predicted thioredoxin/glutaredoxin